MRESEQANDTVDDIERKKPVEAHADGFHCATDDITTHRVRKSGDGQ
jgi:hypothetical protein